MKGVKRSVSAVFLAMIILIFVGFNFDTYNSQNPIEYVVSIAEKFDRSPTGVFHRAWRMIKNNYIDNSYNNQDWDRWRKRYDKVIKTSDDSHLAIDTMMESLDDPYSRFLKEEDFKEQYRNIDSKLHGIGIHISERNGQIIIVNVIEDTPAQKFGLKEKDRILAIGDKSTKGLSLKEVADLIRGKAGTYVIISLLRDQKVITKSILREEIKVKTVKYKSLNKDMGYIRINSFISSDTSNEFKNALYALSDKKGLIVDVRGNYGGLLPNAIEISNMLLDRGNIVSIVDRNQNKEYYNASPDLCLSKEPLVVLIDQSSASASEIFSGALKDNHRAKLVGVKTFGKGKVQRILKLSDGSGINLTVAKYLTPAGTDIDHKGIEPDYKIEFDPDLFAKGNDIQLKKAESLLSQEIKENIPKNVLVQVR
jgi:carboxyl-terminal processing protease